MTGGYARLSGDWTDPLPPDGAPPVAEWPLEAAGPETMHALSTLQEETVAATGAGAAEETPQQSRPSRPVPAPRSLSVQSSTWLHAAGSEAAGSDEGSAPAPSSADERVPSGGTSPPSRPDSGLRKPPRKGQGTVPGHRMSPAVLSAVVEWCQGRRGAAGASGALHCGSGSLSGEQRRLDSLGGGFGGRRRSPAGPAQPAAPTLTGAAARLGGGGHLRRQRAAHLPSVLAEGATVTAAAASHRRRGSSSVASSSSEARRAGGGSARGSLRAESQGTTSVTGTLAGGLLCSSGEDHGFSGTATAEGSGEVPGDGGFELLRRVPGIRTGRRVSFDASLGRGSTDDDEGQPGSPAASSESPEGASSDCGISGGSASETSSHAVGDDALVTSAAHSAQPHRPSERQALAMQPTMVRPLYRFFATRLRPRLLAVSSF